MVGGQSACEKLVKSLSDSFHKKISKDLYDGAFVGAVVSDLTDHCELFSPFAHSKSHRDHSNHFDRSAYLLWSGSPSMEGITTAVRSPQRKVNHFCIHCCVIFDSLHQSIYAAISGTSDDGGDFCGRADWVQCLCSRWDCFTTAFRFLPVSHSNVSVLKREEESKDASNPDGLCLSSVCAGMVWTSMMDTVGWDHVEAADGVCSTSDVSCAIDMVRDAGYKCTMLCNASDCNCSYQLDLGDSLSCPIVLAVFEDAGSFQDQAYFVTHLIFVKSQWGSKTLEVGDFAREVAFLVYNLEEVSDDLELLGEFLHVGRISTSRLNSSQAI